MKIAIPRFRGAVAPCFEVAGKFVLAEVVKGRVESLQVIESEGCEGFGQVRLLRGNDVDVLVCCGIKAFYRDMLKASGMTVIPDVSLSVEKALDAYVTGKLTEVEPAPEPEDYTVAIPLRDLICWTKDLFISHGYEVKFGDDAGPFPIDLIAELSCPRCGKPVRVAVCCGAHAYRFDKEIREFHRVCGDKFSAAVYVHPVSPAVAQCCLEYDMELIDPNVDIPECSRDRKAIPLLHGAVTGHEKASAPNANRRARKSTNNTSADGSPSAQG